MPATTRAQNTTIMIQPAIIQPQPGPYPSHHIIDPTSCDPLASYVHSAARSIGPTPYSTIGRGIGCRADRRAGDRGGRLDREQAQGTERRSARYVDDLDRSPPGRPRGDRKG